MSDGVYAKVIRHDVSDNAMTTLRHSCDTCADTAGYSSLGSIEPTCFLEMEYEFQGAPPS